MKVSIITIVFNNEDCIDNCLNSVKNQTYINIEHIVIDGGSIDRTLDRIEPYKNSLGYFISEKDSGLYNALNKGIKKATGDVIGILHSDDVFYSTDSIEKVVKVFQSKNADIVYANGMYVERDDTNKVKRIYKSKPFKRRYLNFGWIPLHTTIFVKKEVFKYEGMYNESYSIASDYDISLRWFKNRELKKVFLNEWLVKMRLGGKSTTASLQKRKSTEDLEIIKKHKLLGGITLLFKIARKVPQYVLPRIITYKV
ncbi:glycosyltransferase [Lutibacter oricola]|uniref:Glycosyltransferase n=1 Tax=Lutibacter oricola TaxID=762486 RepID=A0A1H2TS80_9FLAO|nr:glycosyltransferase family 2 protein [Lutibacter oricola]SDW46124.1 glycosyltransferase [Lutibacter oricola]